MFSKDYILQQLRAMGAPKDKPIIVHVSLRKVGEVEGRAEGLLKTLIEYFTEKGGAFIVPTHTWSNFDKKKDIILDFNSTETCVGTFPSIALKVSGGVRTDNPTHSAVVFGNRGIVNELIKEESLAVAPTPPNGCYGKLFDLDGYVLLVGVGQEKNTYLHAVEEMLGVKNRLSVNPVKMKIKYKDGKIVIRDYHYMISEGIYDPSLFFPKYEPAFRKHGAIKDGFIGNAPTQLCSARKMKEVMEVIRCNSGGIELLSDDTPLNKSWY